MRPRRLAYLVTEFQGWERVEAEAKLLEDLGYRAWLEQNMRRRSASPSIWRPGSKCSPGKLTS